LRTARGATWYAASTAGRKKNTNVLEEKTIGSER
jgi:hypothetical protein